MNGGPTFGTGPERMKMGISARIRPGIEAAPWVCVEVWKLEESYDAMRIQNERLAKIEAAAKNLVAQKGRHHTQQAYEQLAALLVPNAELTDNTK